MTRSGSWLRRLHGVIQLLHPPRHRRRHRAAIEDLLDELLGRAPNDFERRRLLRRAVADGLGTLLPSWRGELVGRVTPSGFSTRGALDSLRTDVAFALRFHRRRPIYAVVTVATLALAVGANTAIYTVAEAALFRTLPYDAPDRIVEIKGSMQGLFAFTPSYDWKTSEKLETTAGIDGEALYISGGGANLASETGASRLALTQVSESFFQVMGVELALGGGFPGAAGSADVAVLAHSVWTQTFGADPAVLGRTIYLSGLPYRVVGVAPPEVGFPGHTDVWTPQPVRWEFFPDAAGPTLIARLAPGADRSHVETLLQARTEDDRAEAGSTRPPTLEPLRGVLTEGVRVPLLVLMVAAGLVFLLGCLNLAAMGVSHFLRRSGELQVRAALGAGRSRVLRQLVVEAIVVGTFGATAGLALASAGVGLLLAWLPADVPGLSTASIGVESMLLAGGLAGIAALFINTVPALKVISNVRVSCAARLATEDRRQTRLRSGLIVGQVAVALLLVISAGLLGRSLVGLARTPLGIDVESVLLFETHLNHTPRGDAEDEEPYRARVVADRNRYLEQVREGIESMPGVLAFGAVSQLPLSHDMGIGSRVRTREIPDADAVRVSMLQATPGYFAAIGIRLVSGRSFSAPHASTEREVVISRKAAESLFGTTDPTGREVLLPSGRDWKPATIVGVVEEVWIRGPESEPGAQIYTSAYDSLDTQLGFAVRTVGDPREIAGRVVRSLGDVAPDVPVYDLRTSRQAMSQELSARQALALVSSLFAAVALVLASLGIYAMIAEAVIRRRREIGIRIALGASVGALVGSVAWRGFLLAAAGVLVAVPVVFGAGRLLDGVLYNVSSTDPWVLVLAPVVLLAVALLAAWIPARRAARVDPVEVLSAE